MCTVSIVPHSGGFRVTSNRDERRDRAAALRPLVDVLGDRTVIMPIDPAGGGSWIGVNDAGMAAALLNCHRGAAMRFESSASRGAIVRLALGCASLDAAVRSVRALPPARFRPFRLVLVQNGRIALVGGDGRELADAESALDRPLMFTASSLGDLFVAAPRRRLFECLMEHSGDRLAGQHLFHRHQWSDKRDISVVMEREDAATVSRTTVDVGERLAWLEYESLLPRRAVERVELQPC
jgi:hypothetical protein